MRRLPQSTGLTTLFIAVMLALSWSAQAQLSVEDGVRKAGRQRTITQQVIKLYCQVGQELDVADARDELKAAIAIIDTQLAELKGLAVEPELKAAYAKMEETSKALKLAVEQPISRDKAVQLYSEGEKALDAAEKFAEGLVARSKDDNLKVFDAADRQRMLTYRVGASYLMLSWGFTDGPYRANYDSAVLEFEDNMTHLLTNSATPEKGLDLLKQVSKRWASYKSTAQIESGNYYAGMVVTLLNKIYRIMDEAAGLYLAEK